MKLPGFKGEWDVPDSVTINAAGIPTYIWNFRVDRGVLERLEHMANETNADRRARQRDALKGSLSGLSADATKHLAEEVREAAFSAPDVHRRVIEVFERLGVIWPNGYKP